MSSHRRLRHVVSFAVLFCVPSLAALADPTDVKPASQPAAQPKSVPMTGMGGGNAPAAAAPKAKKEHKDDNGDGKGQATLTMEPMKLDWEARAKSMMKFMPSSAKLSETRPEGVTKEPKYVGKPRYVTLTLGTGTPNTFVIAFDEPEGQKAKVYLDLNGDGDLTNDGTGEWPVAKENKENGSTEYRGTWAFKVSWKGEDGVQTHAEYGLNFFHSPDRGQVGYFPAAVRTGKITINGAEYDVMLAENDADARFNKLYDPKKPEIVGEPFPKPVFLHLDKESFNICESFSFDDMNYVATVSDDGSKLSLAPTVKAIKRPRSMEAGASLLKPGTEAPDFEAIVWKAGQDKIDPTSTFKLSDYRGKKIVVIDMWATWCGPCMAGIPHVSKIAEEVKGQDVVVIAMNVSDDEAAFVKFALGKGKDYKFMLARDPAGRETSMAIHSRLYKVSGIPCTYIIGKDGKVADVISGYKAGDTKIEAALQKLGVKIDVN